MSLSLALGTRALCLQVHHGRCPRCPLETHEGCVFQAEDAHLHVNVTPFVTPEDAVTTALQAGHCLTRV